MRCCWQCKDVDNWYCDDIYFHFSFVFFFQKSGLLPDRGSRFADRLPLDTILDRPPAAAVPSRSDDWILRRRRPLITSPSLIVVIFFFFFLFDIIVFRLLVDDASGSCCWNVGGPLPFLSRRRPTGRHLCHENLDPQLGLGRPADTFRASSFDSIV